LKVFSREESRFYRTAVITAVEVFEGRGFEYLHLPLCEPLSVQEKALGELSKNSLAFRDFESGELYALRLDFTTQVVRHVSLIGPESLPLKYYYFGSVFEYTSKLTQKEEAGVEVIGDPSITADWEVIAVLWEFLRRLGKEDLIVSIGHVGIVKGILNRLPPEKRDSVKEAFKEKNITFLREAFPGDSTVPNLVLRQGGFEVLGELNSLNLVKEAEELEEVGRLLEKEGVRFIFDLSEVRDFPYYSGILFEIFQRDKGYPVGGGGRYDGLSGIVEEDFPATGGVIYLSKLVP
jgi:ATP phosphoribosyltransferase regulatory subunit HisZ